tara:strand:+ start:600 stop:1034 length:435 start_codon:yes stop_codon:yes gene_type:complete
MSYTVERKACNFIKGIRWYHIDKQFALEQQEGTNLLRGDVGLLTDCGYREQGLLHNILVKMKAFGYTEFHIYYSKENVAKTGGWHTDNHNVLIVPSLGNIKYLIDDDGKVDEVILQPGDALYIDIGTPHCAVHLEPRITCSFCE